VFFKPSLQPRSQWPRAVWRFGLFGFGLGLGCLVSGRSAVAEPAARAELATVLMSDNLLPEDARSDTTEVRDVRLPFERRVGPQTGRENRARLELAADAAGFLPGVETHGRLRLELTLSPSEAGAALSLRDSSSWLGVGYRSAGWRWRLRGFPIDTNYERLGHLHALDWGGSDVERGESIFVQQRGGVPGFEVSVAGSSVALFAGLRWARAPLGSAPSARPLWGVLLGGRLEATPELCADFGLGYFERASLGVASNTRQGFVEGASLRLMWRRGPDEPELASEPLRPASLQDAPRRLAPDTTPGFALALEGVMLATRLRRFEAPDQAAIVPAPGAALYGSLRGEVFAGHLALLWRSLAFVLRNDPGIVRGESSPPVSRELAELAGWAGVSATLRPWQLSPSLAFGVLAPAALETPSALPGFRQTFVAREAQSIVALPIGSGRLPVIFGRAALRWQASLPTALAVLLDYERDPNRVQFRGSTLGTLRTFARPDQLRAGIALQSRF
jgi:hypothetical protein